MAMAGRSLREGHVYLVHPNKARSETGKTGVIGTVAPVFFDGRQNLSNGDRERRAGAIFSSACPRPVM